MSTAVVSSLYATGSTGTTSSLTITAPSSANTLLVAFSMPTVSAPPTAVTDNQGNAYVQDLASGTTNQAGYMSYVYRCTNPTGSPTAVNVTGTTGSFAANFEVQEVSGLSVASPVSQVINSLGTANGNSLISNTLNITTTTDNEFAFISIDSNNERTLAGVPSGFTSWNGVAKKYNGISNPDVGAAGSKSWLVTFSGNCVAAFRGVLYKTTQILPTLSIDSVSVDNQSGYADTTVTMSAVSGSAVTVDYATTDGTAIAGRDYTATAGTLTFAPGETSKTIRTTILP